MSQAKICNNCKRMITLETESCPSCGCSEFIPVELSPSWLEGEEAKKPKSGR